MPDKKKKESPESSPPPEPTADDSGPITIDPKSMTAETLPLLPLLKKSVAHMKKSNEYVKVTNQELIKLNSGGSKQRRLLWVSALFNLLLLAGLAFALVEQRGLRDRVDAQATTLDKTNAHLVDVVSAMDDTAQAAEDTKAVVEAQPTITVKPADTTDPTSKPVLVVQPKIKRAPKPKGHKKGDPPPPPAHNGKKPPGIEFPLGPPRKKK